MAQPVTIPHRPIQADPLIASLQQVRAILAGGVLGEWHAWPGSMWHGLARLETLLRKLAKSARDPDGLAADIDQTRPTLERQRSKLSATYQRLLEECLYLKWELYRATRSTGNAHGSGASQLALRDRLERFLAQLDQSRKDEANLILESATTDIGTAD
jgi:hypothetical protein